MAPNGRHERKTGEQLVLEEFLPYRLSMLSNTVSNTIARDYRDKFGLSIPEWRVMAVLGRFGPSSAGEVCERTAMDKVTVSRAATGLLERGFVARAADPKDRRRSILTLTPGGRRVHGHIVPIALGHESALTDALTKEERQRLSALLAKLQRRAGELAAG